MQIIKASRKTLSLKIDKTWEIIVKVPYFTTKKTIKNFLEKYKDWILERQKEVLNNKKNFKFWEKFYLYGKEYILEQNTKQKKFFFDWKNFLFYNSKQDEIKQIFIKFYKKEAQNYIKPRVLKISKELDLDFNKIRITSAETRWWSCSSKKNLNFSRKLILTEKEAIDYVIIHELSHLIEMNHSKNFWSLVEKYSEIIWIWDYKNQKKYLKEFTKNNYF